MRQRGTVEYDKVDSRRNFLARLPNANSSSSNIGDPLFVLLTFTMVRFLGAFHLHLSLSVEDAFTL